MANTPARTSDNGPGLVPMVVGGVVAAVVLFWLAGIVISTVVFVIKAAVVIAMIGGALYLWSRFSKDD